MGKLTRGKNTVFSTQHTFDETLNNFGSEGMPFNSITGERIITRRGNTKDNLTGTIAFTDKIKNLAKMRHIFTTLRIILFLVYGVVVGAGEIPALSKTTIDTMNFFSGSTSTLINSLSFSPEGPLIAVGMGSAKVGIEKSNVVVWNVETGQKVSTFPGHYGSFSLDGSSIVVAGTDSVELWSVLKRTKLMSISNERGPIFTLLFLNDGRSLLIQRMFTINIWDIESRAQVKTLAPYLGVSKVDQSSDGKILCASSPDPTTPEVSQILETSFSAIAPMIKRAPGWEKALVVMTSVSGDVIRKFPEYPGLVSAAISADGRFVAIPYEGAIHVREVKTGKEIETIKAAAERVAFSPDGLYLATVTVLEGVVRLWSAKDWSMVKNLSASMGVDLLAFSRDGKYLAAAGGYGSDSKIRIWKLKP